VAQVASAKGVGRETEMAFALTLTLRGIRHFIMAIAIGMPGGGDPEQPANFPAAGAKTRKNTFSERGGHASSRKYFRISDALHCGPEHAA